MRIWSLREAKTDDWKHGGMLDGDKNRKFSKEHELCPRFVNVLRNAFGSNNSTGVPVSELVHGTESARAALIELFIVLEGENVRSEGNHSITFVRKTIIGILD
jgi:hypothetical protein